MTNRFVILLSTVALLSSATVAATHFEKEMAKVSKRTKPAAVAARAEQAWTWLLNYQNEEQRKTWCRPNEYLRKNLAVKEFEWTLEERAQIREEILKPRGEKELVKFDRETQELKDAQAKWQKSLEEFGAKELSDKDRERYEKFCEQHAGYLAEREENEKRSRAVRLKAIKDSFKKDTYAAGRKAKQAKEEAELPKEVADARAAQKKAREETYKKELELSRTNETSCCRTIPDDLESAVNFNREMAKVGHWSHPFVIGERAVLMVRRRFAHDNHLQQVPAYVEWNARNSYHRYTLELESVEDALEKREQIRAEVLEPLGEEVLVSFDRDTRNLQESQKKIQEKLEAISWTDKDQDWYDRRCVNVAEYAADLVEEEKNRREGALEALKAALKKDAAAEEKSERGREAEFKAQAAANKAGREAYKKALKNASKDMSSSKPKSKKPKPEKPKAKKKDAE